MKIVQVNTYDVQGGAARAAYRLHQGLVKIGQDSTLLSRFKASQDPTVQVINLAENVDFCLSDPYSCAVQKHYINFNRSAVSNTPFSFSYPGLDISRNSHIITSDVINLHWVALFQSPASLQKLLSLGKPIVWTLHDMFAFTGGCHYSVGCEKYQTDCINCPLLVDDSYHLASTVLAHKLELLDDNQITVVCPSQWLADCARKSQLFQKNRVETIPYSLETDIFVATPKAEAKQALSIQPNTLTLGIGAHSGNEIRKGFFILIAALQECFHDSRFQALVAQGQFALISFGAPNSDLSSLNLPVISFGQVESDEYLSQIYSATDLFVLPSLEDNLPNTMLEAMSCGTPVIGFATGGIPDMVKDGVTGKLAPVGDAHQLAKAILDCLFDADLRDRMSQNCRQMMEESYSLPVQANRYLDLYQDLLSDRSSHPLSIPATPASIDPEFHSLFEVTGQSSPFDRVAAYSLLAEVQELRSQRQQVQTGWQSADVQYQKTQQDLEYARSQWQETQRHLDYAQAQWKETQQHLDYAQARWKETQEALDKLQEKRQLLQEQLSQSKASLQEVRKELQQTQKTLSASQDEILAMQSSKFWKLRTAWLKVKDKFPFKRHSEP